MFYYGLTNLTVLYFTYSFLGWLWGTLFLILLVKVGDKILLSCGYLRLNYGDICMSIEKPGINHNISGYAILDKENYSDFNKFIFERGVKKVFKLRSIFVKKLGILLWQDQGPQAGRDQIKLCTEEIHDEDSLCHFAEKICNLKMDYSKPLWEFHFIENYSETQSAMVMRMHHTCADGGGIVGLFSAMNDPDKRLKISKEFPKIGFVQDLVLTFICPIYSVYLLAKKALFHSDKEASKINELKNNDSHYVKFYSSKQSFEFTDVKKCYKRFDGNPKFNDYLMGTLSVSLKKWYDKYGHADAHKIKLVNSVNMRNLPKDISEITLYNESIGVQFELPIKHEFEAAMNEAKTNFHKDLGLFEIICLRKISDTFPFLPEVVLKFFMNEFYNGVDFMFTNLPMSSEPCYIANREVTKIGVFPKMHNSVNFFFIASTYENRLYLSACANGSLKMDPQLLLDYASEYISEDIRISQK
ncbi:unnamed protein product [Moneuplotes crassus]|uniref:Diacylglycerol O-acyltransferase n=1 Tax=Euplotes crassus TaxID=5936 RepID=A0AAD1UDQ7_EUPCR|nr:unnamed protein product [Moneuplotes crassus]